VRNWLRSAATDCLRRAPHEAAEPQRPATVLLQNVEVYSVVSAGSGSVATIVVPARSATVLAALSTQNRIALTQMT
jgi:hypothetical protein